MDAGALESVATGCASMVRHGITSVSLLVYRAMNYNLPRRAKRRLPARLRQLLVVPSASGRMWSMNFMHDTLYCG